MNGQLDRQLVEEYPKIFAQRNLGEMETNMCWGFQCDDGWYWLIDQLCASLQWDIDHNQYPQAVATCVKEKFGTLRFYIAPIHVEWQDQLANRAIGDQLSVQEGMIRLAQSMSARICENCGSTQDVKLRGKHWVKTLCEDCITLNSFWEDYGDHG